MSVPKLTPWFRGRVKPVRAGIYEREYGLNRRVFTEWNGVCWGWAFYEGERSTPHFARGPVQDKRWRGLAQKP